MPCLWEEVEGLDLVDLIAVLEEAFEIPHLGRGIARDVDDLGGAVVEELGEKVFTATLARGVDDDGGFLCAEFDVGEELLGGGGDKLGVLDAIGEGVPAGPVGRGFREFDADDLFKYLLATRRPQISFARVARGGGGGGACPALNIKNCIMGRTKF